MSKIGYKKECETCKGCGTVVNMDDHTTPRDCTTCNGRGYVWTRCDALPSADGARKERLG